MLAQPLFSSWGLCESSQVWFGFHQAVSSLDAMSVWFSFLQSHSILLVRFQCIILDTRSELLGSVFHGGSGCLSCYRAEFFLKWNLASVLLVVSALDPAREREVFPTFSFYYCCSCPGCALFSSVDCFSDRSFSDFLRLFPEDSYLLCRTTVCHLGFLMFHLRACWLTYWSPQLSPIAPVSNRFQQMPSGEIILRQSEFQSRPKKEPHVQSSRETPGRLDIGDRLVMRLWKHSILILSSSHCLGCSVGWSQDVGL